MVTFEPKNRISFNKVILYVQQCQQISPEKTNPQNIQSKDFKKIDSVAYRIRLKSLDKNRLINKKALDNINIGHKMLQVDKYKIKAWTSLNGRSHFYQMNQTYI